MGDRETLRKQVSEDIIFNFIPKEKLGIEYIAGRNTPERKYSSYRDLRWGSRFCHQWEVTTPGPAGSAPSGSVSRLLQSQLSSYLAQCHNPSVLEAVRSQFTQDRARVMGKLPKQLSHVIKIQVSCYGFKAMSKTVPGTPQTEPVPHIRQKIHTEPVREKGHLHTAISHATPEFKFSLCQKKGLSLIILNFG